MSKLTENSPIKLNPDLEYLGTETAFGFGAEVMSVEASKKFPQVYKFHVGDTGPKTPEPIIEVAIQALRDKQTKYGHYQGFLPVRENIAKHFSKTRGIEVKPENILLTPAGKPVIELAMQTLLAPGDLVVGQSPGYPIYESLARFYNEDRYLPWVAQSTPESTLEFVVSDLEEILKTNKNVKLLVLNTPQNPTGMMISEEKQRQIAALAQKYDFYILFDDIYDRITFSGRKHFSILSVPGMLDRVINLNGYSKNYAMTGWRLGFAVGPKWLIDIFGTLAINKWSCVNTVDQIVAGSIFGPVEINGFKYPSVAEEIESLLLADYTEYEKKGKFLYESLKLLEPFVVPNPIEGAFYLFPNIEQILALPYVRNELKIENENQFTRWLLYERGIATLAGPDFGIGGRGHIRFSYAEDRHNHIIPGARQFVKVILELIEKSGLKAPLTEEEVDQKIAVLVDKCFI